MAFTINDSDKILVVAPHPDDESIGCGGLLALYGRQCDVLLLTDGRKGKSAGRQNLSDSDISEVRKAELQNALNIANINQLFCLNIPDSELSRHKKEVFRFDAAPYKYIFVPNSHENHPDHIAANKFFKSMRFWGKTKARIYEYEVWTPLHTVDVLINIEPKLAEKEKMIRQHISQLECKDYLNAGMGLSAYRGIGCNSQGAEAFFYSPASLMDKFKRVYSIIKH